MNQGIKPFAILSPDRGTKDGRPRRSVGRPAVIDPEATAACALRLFDEHGYDAVTMEQVAKAAGIGRKSLYRYFASKADLVWGGSLPVASKAVSLIEGKKAKSPEDAFATLREYARASSEDLDAEVTRIRLRLTNQHRELAGYGYSFLAERGRAIAEYLERSGIAQPRASYLGAAVISAIHAAWVLWALSDDESPAPYLAEAVDVVL
ncbi:TetR family transcriptional regulator [Zhihengliuella flava]|uniref:AcrR family transcriptional regulator n=1 Tax=Zhihengliuella flava TaxID=1285193 RepID=A0A931D464_9MICC|nr:TetR family transcriptional regulator [Zhihengliuella flava]MBG6084089.1 AcrR family transcriptional regulator [Zhihengliuella flava]